MARGLDSFCIRYLCLACILPACRGEAPEQNEAAHRRLVRRYSDMQEAEISPHGQVLLSSDGNPAGEAAVTAGSVHAEDKVNDQYNKAHDAIFGPSDNGPPKQEENSFGAMDLAEELAREANYDNDNTDVCFDAATTGRTHPNGKAIPETCNQLMYSYRHYSGDACSSSTHGPVVRQNCKRSCGCCCKDQLHSGTHDKNGLEVTCSQVAIWTTDLKYDYCNNDHFGATVRQNCPGLCCTCDAAEKQALYTDHLHTNLNGSAPYKAIQDHLHLTMSKLSQVAQGVEVMGTRVPAIMGLVTGSTTPSPRPLGDAVNTGTTATTTAGTQPEVYEKL